MNENWQEIIKKAMDSGLASSKGAVPGAKLRQIIAHIAPSYGEQYPPMGHESEKFRVFLGHFVSLVTAMGRTSLSLHLTDRSCSAPQKPGRLSSAKICLKPLLASHENPPRWNPGTIGTPIKSSGKRRTRPPFPTTSPKSPQPLLPRNWKIDESSPIP